jgi:hypothetical protein
VDHTTGFVACRKQQICPLEEQGQLNSQRAEIGPVATNFVLTKVNPDWRVDRHCEQ